MSRRRSKLEIETGRIECARNLLQLVVDGHRKGVATPEGVAFISNAIMTIAMLEREIGRRLTGGLSDLELAHRDISPTPK
jgi:hypothetical protein